MRRLCVVFMAFVMVVGVLPAATAVADTGDEQIANTATNRQLKKSLPKAKQVGNGASVVSTSRLFNAQERCPGVPRSGPSFENGHGRTFETRTAIVTVQVVAFAGNRAAKRALRSWHNQLRNLCNNVTIDGTRFELQNRKAAPAPTVGDQRRALNQRFYDAVSGEQTSAGLVIAHRFGNIVVVINYARFEGSVNPTTQDAQNVARIVGRMSNRLEAISG